MGKVVWREMTVAKIREIQGAASVKVAFLESPRFYALSRSHPGFDRILTQLRHAMEHGRPVKVQLPSIDSGIIQDVA